MTMLDPILAKLGLHKHAAHNPSAPAHIRGADPQTAHVGTQPVKVPIIDVVSKLDRLASANPTPLDWKVSIVDLLALLGLDHSAEAVKELAVELGCPASEMRAAARRKRWLHWAVMKKIAEHGGNVPLGPSHK
jgi:hypothetical protein